MCWIWDVEISPLAPGSDPFCGRYIAAEVVEGLIGRNKLRFASNSVEFRALDMINDVQYGTLEAASL